MPVPIDRSDDAYFAPVKQLNRTQGTELYLGLVHAKGGVEGTKRRMQADRKVTPDFGIATECGMARTRTVEMVKELLRVHAEASA
jgi:hypothetical protein